MEESLSKNAYLLLFKDIRRDKERQGETRRDTEKWIGREEKAVEEGVEKERGSCY